jgi:hypothetical protein
MDVTVSINDATKEAALQKALAVYNASAAPISPEAFLQKLIDGQLDGLVKSYVVAQMDRITWLKERFTQAERAAIRQAAMTNGAVADLCAMVDGASVVHFDDPVTIGGIAALEAAGLLAPGRGAEILAL